MPDFDVNDDSLRLSGAGRDEPLPKLTPRFSPRSRELASRQCRVGASRAPQRIATRLAGSRRAASRHVCPRGERVLLLASAPVRRRRLWTACHGHPSGSPS
jgi:hypothetical protein